jgi:peptidoglycan/LPS O-acetylase OafA/YrhL
MDFISLLRFLATVAITNSHFGELYPIGYSSLATGGMIGNAIFFFCSGYTLYLSIVKTKLNSYRWLLKRLFRLYPSIWIFRIFTFLFLGKTLFWFNFLIPGYWFLNAIIIFYILFYFIVRYFHKYLNWIFGLLFVLCFFNFSLQTFQYQKFIIEQTSNIYYLHYFYLFAIMLFGSYCAQKRENLQIRKNWDIIFSILTIILYYGFKGFVIKLKLWYPQLIVPLLLILVIFYLYKVSIYFSTIKLFLNNKIKKIVYYASTLTVRYIHSSICLY